MDIRLEDRVLAIDFGLERIGLALSYGALAEPLEILANRPSTLEHILEIIKRNNVSHILVGQSEQEMAKHSADFAAELRQKLTIPVILVDETLSTKEVERQLRERRQPGKRGHRGRVDHFAAAHILQTYLDEHL